MKTIEKMSKPYPITPNNGKHHFFGYYAISPWSKNGKYFVCLETDFQDHFPKKGEKANILLINLNENRSRVIGDTLGFNLQQGAMLHWLPSASDSKIIYNDCEDGKVISKILNVKTGEEKIHPMGINALAHTKDLALCLSFGRLRSCRKVCSYACVEKEGLDKHPKDDGIYTMDLKTGKTKMILSLEEVWESNSYTKNKKLFYSPFWFNHVVFSPDDERFSFLSRFHPWLSGYRTAMWTCGVNGKELHLITDYKNKVSHFEWISPEELMITAKYQTNQYFHMICKDRSSQKRKIAPDILYWNGHPAKHPKLNLIATDTYVIDGNRHLYLVDLETEEVKEIARFKNPWGIRGDYRCDPHPRWHPNGKKLSFDGLTEKDYGRQVFCIDFEF